MPPTCQQATVIHDTHTHIHTHTHNNHININIYGTPSLFPLIQGIRRKQGRGKQKGNLSTTVAGNRRLPLPARLSALLRPGEVQHGRDKEAVAVIGDTSPGIVPREESPENGEEATRLLEASVGQFHLVTDEVGNTKEDEGDVDKEEQQEEGQCGAESEVGDHSGEDDPALWVVNLLALGQKSARGILTKMNNPRAS